MPYDFPTNPVTGTVVTVPDGSYRVWDSQKWRAAPSSNAIMPPTGFLPLTGGTVNGDVTITGSAASGNMGTYLTLTGGVSTFSMNAALGKSVRITLGGAGTGFNINPGGTATDNPLAITAGASAGLHVIDVTNSKFRTKLQKINGSYALSGAYSDDTAPLAMALNISGTPAFTSGGYPVMRWATTGDTADARTSGSLRLVSLQHNWGGPAMTGDRQAMLIRLTQVARSGNPNVVIGGTITPQDANYQPISVGSFVSFNEGGTGTASRTQAMGHNFGFGVYASLANTGDNGDGTHGATNWYVNNGCEWDIQAQAGTSVMRQFGFDIVHLQGHAVQGTVEDAAIMVADQANDPGGLGNTIGWKTIFQVGSPMGQDPLGIGSGIMQWRSPSHPGVKIPQADYGIDIALGAISGNAFASRGFSVEGNGLTNHFQAEIAQTGSGVSVDVRNSIINLGSLVSGGTLSQFYSVGDWFGDVNTGLIVSTSTLTAGGSITAVTQQRGGYALTNPGTVVLANMNNEIGGSITVTTSGTLSNALSLQPSGGATVFGGPVTLPAGSTGAFLPLIGGVVTGPTTFSAGLSGAIGAVATNTGAFIRVRSDPAGTQLPINLAGAADSLSTNWLWSSTRIFGSSSGVAEAATGDSTLIASNKLILSDGAIIPAPTYSMFYVFLSAAGNTDPTNTASRTALQARIAVNGQTGPSAIAGIRPATIATAVAQLSIAFSVHTQGGAGGWNSSLNPNLGYFRGALFGGNDNAWLASGAANYSQLVGREVDTSIQGTATCFQRFGILLNVLTSASQAIGDDAAMVFVSQTVNGNNHKNSIQFGCTSQAIEVTDSLIKVVAQLYPTPSTPALVNGIDFTGGTFSGSAIATPGFSVGGSGATTAASYIIGASGPTITSGSAVPASTQPKGSLYTRTGGGVGTTLYVSQGGGTWNPVAGV